MAALGVLVAQRADVLLDADYVRRLAALLEGEQCESVWIGDHPARGRDRDGRSFPSPLEWLTMVAAHSSTLVLGTAVLVLPAQHPAVLAKRIATVDRLSNGRLIVGVGIGDSASEADALAVDRTHRAALTTESIEVMRTIWTADRGASFDGRLFTLHDIDAAPRPAQPLGPRITIGGHSVAAARRAGRLGYGLIPLGVAPDAIETLLAEARKEAEHGGWDTESIELTVSFDRDPATLHRLADIGAHRFVLDAPPSGDLDELRDAIRAARSSIADLGRATTR